MKTPGLTTRDRLLVYFASNREEELSLRDIASKWSITKEAASEVTMKMRKDGVLDWRVEKGRVIVVWPGPRLRELF